MGCRTAYWLRSFPESCCYSLEADLTQTGDPDFAPFADVRLGSPFDPQTSNTGMPEAFSTYINKGINEETSHQKTHGWWYRWVNHVDRRLNPMRMVYEARAWDSQLRDWQQANCARPGQTA